MERGRKLLFAKMAAITAAIPFIIWAYEYGPNPGYCGVPKENGTCTAAGCHTGTTNNPANKGSVTINFPNGMTYTPGVKQHLMVVISDPATTQGAWGFQTTARLASNTATMAGSFAPTDNHTQIMCSQPNLFIFQGVCLAGAAGAEAGSCNQMATPACPSAETLQYMEHSYNGYASTMGPGSGSYEFDWTPPSTNVGNVTFYIAGNAGVPGPPNQNGDHIYATSFTLTPQAASGNGPTISSNGVVNGASFQPGMVPGSWVTIQGSNLASTTDTWANAIVNDKLPTSLDGVSVSIGGQPAYIYYISPTQINAIAPNIGTGSMQATVTSGSSTSSAASVTSSTVSPAFFLWASQYVVATRQDGSLAVKNGTFGSATTPAKAGDVLILWGTGFGPTTPAAPAGVQTPSDQIYNTASPVTVTIGGIQATVYGTALSPGFAGLYQVAIQVPPNAPSGDLPLIATINGAQSPQNVTLTVQ